MITKQSFEKYLPIIYTDKGNIFNEMRQGEAVQIVMNNFAQYLFTMGIPNYSIMPIIDNIGSHLILFEKITRCEEQEKCKTEKEVDKVLRPAMNLKNFKRSMMLLAKDYIKNKKEREVLNKIITRIKIKL